MVPVAQQQTNINLSQKLEKRNKKLEKKNEIENLRQRIATLEDQLKTALKDTEDFKALLVVAQQQNVALQKRLDELQQK